VPICRPMPSGLMIGAAHFTAMTSLTSNPPWSRATADRWAVAT
jgi:hypothetical protein